MSNLDNLISKILNDCEEESKRIIEAADKEASEIIQKSVNAAEKEKEHLLKEAEADAEKTVRQMLLSKKLEARDEALSAKREIIKKVFDHALLKLNNMPKDEYMQYLYRNLPAISLEGGELTLPIKYGISSDELYSFFSSCALAHIEKEQMPDIKLCEGEKSINGGFIFNKDGVEYNHTFEMLLQYYRYELESEVIKILF